MPGVEQRPGLPLAGGRAAVGDDQVEAVVGADLAADVDLGRQRVKIFGGRLRRHAGRAQRPVEPVAGPAADPQRAGVDGDRLLGQRQRAVLGPDDLEVQAKPGAERDALDRPAAPFLRPSTTDTGVPGAIAGRGRGDHRGGVAGIGISRAGAGEQRAHRIAGAISHAQARPSAGRARGRSARPLVATSRMPVRAPADSGAMAERLPLQLLRAAPLDVARGIAAIATPHSSAASAPACATSARRSASGRRSRSARQEWMRVRQERPLKPPPSAIEVKTPLNSAPIRSLALWSARCHIRTMARRDEAPVRAILGPTNTGKTHLAIERMCAHSSGVIGFPLRLLAREVYDRVVAIEGRQPGRAAHRRGAHRPATARATSCAPPNQHAGRRRQGRAARRPAADFAFAAIDEAQLGIDPERGHVFTDRMLRARGREETLILGSDTLEAADPRTAARGRDRQPAALFDPALCRRSQAVAPAAALGRRRLLGRAGLRAGRDAAPLQRRRGGGDGRAVAGHPQRPGGDVPARRGRLSGRHRRHRHGPQHGRHPCRLRRAGEVRRAPRPPADHRRNGADRRPRRAPPERRQLRHAGPWRRRRRRSSATRKSTRSRSIASARSTISTGAAPSSISPTSPT